MTNFLKAATSMGLVLMLGLTASAQSGNQDEKSSSQKSDNSDRKKSETSNSQKSEKSDSKKKGDQQHQGSGQVERIRGELAAVSVVGETMVNYKTGRGIVAEFSYLTILGSPAGGKGGQGDSKQSAQGHASGAEKKDQGSDQGQANKGQDHSGSASASRRNVYEIAIGPDTQVRSRGSQGGQGSGEKPQGSARERSQSALGQLELGDRVLVEFERLSDQAKSGSGGEAQGGSASQSRHGRHRIVRGFAKTLTILPSPDGGDQKGSQGKKDGNSSEKGQSGSDAGQKKSDQDK